MTEDLWLPDDTPRIHEFPPPSAVSLDPTCWLSTFGYSEFEDFARKLVAGLTQWNDEIYLEDFREVAVIAHFVHRGFLVPGDNDSGEYLGYWYVSRRFVKQLQQKGLFEKPERESS